MSRSKTGKTISRGKVFKKGFNAFLYLPQKRLERELQLRGLLDYEDPEDDFDDIGKCDESELMVMLSGMVGGNCTID